MKCTLPLNGIRFLTAIEVVLRKVNTKFISIPLAEMAINVLIIIRMRRGESERIAVFSHNHSS